MSLSPALLLALLGAPAQIALPDPSISRFQTLEYRAEQVYPLVVAPGFALTVELAPDEGVQSVAVGDSTTWQVSVDKAGNHLFVKPLQSGSATNMTVITNVRVYAFDLISAASGGSAYNVRFRYPANIERAAQDPKAEVGTYHLTGARTLMPERMSDDGNHVYIEWPKDADLPAVYAVDARGHETLVNGMMRNDRLVVDGVAPRLVFRIDDKVARAERVVARRKH